MIQDRELGINDERISPQHSKSRQYADKLTVFTESAARSCPILYRMGGLRHTLLYLLDLMGQALPVARLNAMYVARDLSSIIAMADTGTVLVSSKYSLSGGKPPCLMPERMREELIVDDLAPYQNSSLLSDPQHSDLPYLFHRALLRIPLFETEDYIFVMNCWADIPGIFDKTDMELVRNLFGPLAAELKTNLTGVRLIPPTGTPMAWLSGRDKLALCPGLASTLRLAEHAAQTESTVLILGETGVGKEGVADVIHDLSPRRTGPFVKVNCGAISESLMESELFGHEKGAFTGAVSTRPGYFEMADGGTIFLDEIGEMSMSAQVRLLRVLDCGCVMRVGTAKALPLNVRIIAATQADLPAKVVAGTFRKDLWYRLSVFVLEVPPLRRRRGDIPPLVEHFIHEKARKLKLPYVAPVTEKDLSGLYHYEWPGNVRELEHVVERALLRNSMESKSRALHFEIMPLPTPHGMEQQDHPSSASGMPRAGNIHETWPTLREHENDYIKKVLERCRGKLTGTNSATSILNIHYTTLRARLEQITGTSNFLENDSEKQ